MFFDDTIIKTFYVQNQPLVESPDTRNLIGALMESVLKDEDMMFHIQKDIISNFGKPEVHKFNRSVESGRYAPGYPEVEVKINIRSNQKIIDALVDKFGNYDYVILEGKVGKLTDYDWVINHYYLIDQTTFDLDGNFLLNFYHEIDEINYDWVIVDANLATGVDELGDPYPPGTYHISLKEPPATSYTDRNYHITEVLPDKPEGLYYVIKYKYSYLDAGGEMVTKYGYFYHLASSTEYANLTLPPFDFDQSVQCTDFDDSPPVIPTQSGNSCWDKTLDEAGNPGSLVYFDGKHFLYTIGGKGFRTASEDGDRTDKPA